MVAEHKGTLPPIAMRILTGVPELVFAHVHDADGRLIAVARGAVTGPGRWLGISLVQTAPDARRRGIAQQVVGGARPVGGAARQQSRLPPGGGAQRGRGGAVRPGSASATHHTYLTREAPL